MFRFVAVVWIGIGVFPACACSIDPFTWEQLALFSDFAGVVTCSAGGTWTSEYRVDESWKGAPAGTLLVAFTPAVLEYDSKPKTNTGDRFVAFLFKTTSRNGDFMSRVGGLDNPEASAPYMFPPYQGKAKLSDAAGQSNPFGQAGSKHPTLEALRTDVQRFLAMTPEQQELAVLKALSRKYIPMRVEYEQQISGTAPPARDADALINKLDTPVTVDAFLDTLFGLEPELPPYALDEIVGGRYTATLRYLRENVGNGKPYAANNAYVARILRIRVGDITWRDEQ